MTDEWRPTAHLWFDSSDSDESVFMHTVAACNLGVDDGDTGCFVWDPCSAGVLADVSAFVEDWLRP